MVVFADCVLEVFNAHRQLQAADSEAGGVLLGRRRGQHFEVTHATAPFPTDARTRTSFVRESMGHQEQASAVWASSGHEIGYLGEWHTHPEKVPRPSHIDTNQWRQSSRDIKCQIPFLAVIMGQANLYVGLWHNGHAISALQTVRTA